MGEFVSLLCNAVAHAEPTASEEEAFGLAIADTLSVAAAGFCENTLTRLSEAYAMPHSAKSTWLAWDGSPRASLEDCILINATAAHALDYDDLDMACSAHLNAILVPSVLSGDPPQAELALSAIKAGTLAARAIGLRLGRDHYRRGFHATATLGTFAATAAHGRLMNLTQPQLHHAFALAGSQFAGLRANFGADAKALHAGFAATAGLRSARLAKAGITGARDIFEDGGFFALYGAPDDSEAVSIFSNLENGPRLIKLFPCCFAVHRLVGAALQVRKVLGDNVDFSSLRIIAELPADALSILRFGLPTTGMEAAFSASYCSAIALIDGPPEIRHFCEEFGRRDIAELAAQVEVRVSETAGNGLDSGHVSLSLLSPSGSKYCFEQPIMPGSADDAELEAGLRAKIATCLGRFKSTFSDTFPVLHKVEGWTSVERWLTEPDRH